MPLEGNPLTDFMLWGHIEYQIVDGSPEANMSFDRGTVPMSIYVSWEQFNDNQVVEVGVSDAATMFIGNVELINTGLGGVTLHRSNPHPFPTRPWMHATSVQQARPMGMRAAEFYPEASFIPRYNVSHGTGNRLNGTGLPRYQQVQLDLIYSMLPYKIKEDTDVLVQNDDPTSKLYLYPDEGMAISKGYRTHSRYITREIKRQAKMLTLPRGLLKDEFGKPIMEALVIPENTAIFEYTWWQVPDEALPEEQWLIGAHSVNHATFDGRPAGTLLFAGDPETRSMPNPITGKRLNTVKYTFYSLIILDEDPPIPEVAPAPRGHNYVRKVISNKLKPVMFSTDGTGTAAGTRIFPDYDFRKLFRPDQVY